MAMASSRRQKTVIFDLSAVRACSCGKVIGRFDPCCQLHRVLQLAPRCTVNHRCINCFDKDFDSKVIASISGEWIRAQRKIPYHIRAMYDKEMGRYGITNIWSHNPVSDTDRYMTEPMQLTPRQEQWPTVTVAYARHVRSMAPLDVGWTDAPSPGTPLTSPAQDAGSVPVKDIKQEPAEDDEPAMDPNVFKTLPLGAPEWAEFKAGADGRYYAVDMERMFMWTYEPATNSCRRKDLLDDVDRAPRPPVVSRRQRTATVSKPPVTDSDVMDEDVIVTGCEPAGSVSKWIQDTTALTTSTNTVTTQPPQQPAPAATTTAPSTPAVWTGLKDFQQADSYQISDSPAVGDFGFAPGSQGQLAMVTRRRHRRAGSERSAEGRGKYSTQPGSYKYQGIVPVIWETVYPARSNDVPVIVTSDVFGRNPLDVVKPHPLYGVPIKESVRDQIGDTLGVLYSSSSGSMDELGTVTYLDQNLVRMAPYTAPHDDFALASTPYLHCRDSASPVGVVPDNATLNVKQSELTKLHFLLLQLMRVMNFVLVSGDAEHLLRKRFTALGQLDPQLARILSAREEAMIDVFKCATESFVAVHLWCRDVALQNSGKVFTEMDLKRLRYGPMEGTDMFIHPQVLGSLEAPRGASVSPTLGNQSQPGVAPDPSGSDATTSPEHDDTMEEGEVRERAERDVTSETVSSTPLPPAGQLAGRLSVATPTRRRLRADSDKTASAPASPAAMDQE